MARFKPAAARKPQPPSLTPEQERAWRAVQAFNKYTSTLTNFARTMTGNKKIIVRSGKITQTDGKTIWIRPPMSMGDNHVHDKALCDIRDHTMTLMCEACNASDGTWRRIYHEMSHIIGNSMAQPTGASRAHVMNLIDEWHPQTVCDHGKAMKVAVVKADNYQALCDAFDKTLQLMMQAVEDARIDAHMLHAKPGLRKQYQAGSYSSFVLGIDQDNGEVLHWRDSPINAQMVVGLTLVSMQYKMDDQWLRREVLDLLEDEQIMNIMARPHEWETVHDALPHVIAVFKRFNELGVCVVDKCLPTPPPEDEPDEQEKPPSLNKEQDENGGEGGQNDEQESNDEPGTDGSGSDEDASSDSGDPDSDDADSSSDGGDGSGDGDGNSQEDATGDGTEGDTASASATGTQPEQASDGDDGEDNQAGDSSGQADANQVPGDDDGDERSSGGPGSSDSSDNGEHRDSDDDGGSDNQADAVDSAPDEDESGADSDGTAEGRSTPGESPDGDESSSDPSTDDAQVGSGDIEGEPADPQDHDPAQDTDASNGANASEAGGDGEPGSDADPDDSRGEDAGQDADSELDIDADQGVDEDEDDDLDTVGEDVWDEDNPPMTRVFTEFSDEEMGDAAAIEEAFDKLGGHEEQVLGEASTEDSSEDAFDYDDEQVKVSKNQALDDAIGQSQYFDTASVGVAGVTEFTFPNRNFKWVARYHTTPDQFMPSEKIIGASLLKGRIVFAANKRSKNVGNLNSGKVNGRVLGRRAPLADDRLFKQKIMPKRRDYVVAITVDCSGSTISMHRMERIKRAVFAKAEMLNRLGVPFYVTGHSGGLEEWYTRGYNEDDTRLEDLWILWVKRLNEPWNDDTRERLANLVPLANNFDGHTLEFHRKELMKSQATDKVMIYYTDGEMPAANYEEELVILQEELRKYDRAKIARLAVGINTSSPESYGFDTVRVDSDDDLIKVVDQLERYLTR